MGRAAAPLTRLVIPAVPLGLGVAALAVFPSHLLYTASTALWYGLVAIGLYLPMAALQELPLHGAGLAGMSAYLFSYMAQQGGVDNLVLGVAFAVGASVVASLLAGLASLAVTGLYFTVASLVVQTYIERTIFPIGELTLGASGRGVPRPQLDGWFNTNRAVFLIAASVALVVTTVVWAVGRTRLLPVWVMTGHQPEGADAIGIRRPLHKLTVFGLSGLLIGIAGCLAAFVNGTPPSVPQFNWIWSVLFIAIPLASGMRTISALWLVAAGYIAIPVVLEDYRINPNLMAGASSSSRCWPAGPMPPSWPGSGGACSLRAKKSPPPRCRVGRTPPAAEPTGATGLSSGRTSRSISVASGRSTVSTYG